MSDMSVKVLIDLLYDSSKAQQAEKDLARIEQAIAAADKAAQAFTKDYDLAEQGAANFGQALDTASDTVTATAEAVDRAQAALDTLGTGFAGAAGGAADAAAAFERTGGALAAIDGVDPFLKLDGSLARAEEQAQQLAGAIRAIDAGEAVPAGMEAVDAALREQKLLAEQARAAIEMPATDGALGAVEAVDAALREQTLLAEQARAAIETPATDGALGAVEAVTEALRQQLALEEEVRRLLAEPVPPSPVRAYVEQAQAERQAAQGPWTFPNGAPVPPLVPRDDASEQATPIDHMSVPISPSEEIDAVERANAEQAAIIERQDAAREQQAKDRREERERVQLSGKPSPEEDEKGHGSGGGAVGGMVEGVVGFAEAATGLKLVEESLKEAAAAKTMDEHLRALNVPDQEIAQLHEGARSISRATKFISENKALEGLLDVRTVMGTTEAALKVMPHLAKMLTIQESIDPGHGAEDAFDYIKSMESSSKTKTPEQLYEGLDHLAKVQEFNRNTIHPGEFRKFYQRAGAAGQHLPEEFELGAMPHLIQEMGGDQAGTMVNSVNRAVVGGQMTQQAIKSFKELGLLDLSHVDIDKKGHYTLGPGGIKGTAEPGHPWNPAEWFKKWYEPALHGDFNAALKEHPLSPEQIEHHYTSDFSNRNVAKGAALFIEQEGIIQKDLDNVRRAKGLSAASDLLAKDPHLAAASVTGQVETFLTGAGGPVMGALAPIENTVGELLSKANQTFERIPGSQTAVAAGVSAGLLAVGAKTIEHGVWNSAKWAARGLGNTLEGAGRFAGPVVGPTLLAIEAGEYDKQLREDTARTWNTPQAQALPDLGQQSWSDFLWGRLPAKATPLPDWGSVSRAANELNRPPSIDGGAGAPLHVIVDGQGSAATPAAPASLTTPSPPTGGTATPTLAQPVVNNTTNNSTTNAPVTVNAPVNVTVNVASPAAAPAAVGSAVGAAAASAITSAVKQSPGVLHDGYGPH